MTSSIDVRCDDDCRNSPRKADARDLVIAWAEGDSETVREALIDDASWDVVGRDDVLDAEGIDKYIAEIAKRKPSSLHIKNLLSHGKGVAVDGSLDTDKGTLGFSHVVTYDSHSKNSKVAEVTSYVVPDRSAA